MKAGLLTEAIEIYEPIITTTEYGNTKKTWGLFYKTRANVIYNSGSRIVENQEIFYPTNITFIVRKYVPVKEPMRIKFNDKYYQIISITPNKFYSNQEIYTQLVNE